MTWTLDPDVAPGAEPLVYSSPGTAAAAAAAAAGSGGGGGGVEAASAPNREGTRDPLMLRSISFRRRIWVNIMFETIQMDLYMKIYVSYGRDSASCSDAVLHTWKKKESVSHLLGS